jgi:hypothetical protein
MYRRQDAGSLTSVTSTTHRGDLLRPTVRRELVLVLVLYVGYSLARLVGDPDLRTAVEHARAILHLEAALNLDVENWANGLLAATPLVALLGSYWYSLLHYVVTPAVLVWAYRRHAGEYRRVRNALVGATVLGLVGFFLMPTAPPRLMKGYVDTLAVTSTYGWWGADASAPRGLGGLTNELAAMPSLHVGWAIWCAWVIFRCSRRRSVRLAALCYPLVTTGVVVATANHWLLDAVAGALVVAGGVAISGAMLRRRADPPTAAVLRRRPPAEDGRHELAV